MSNEEQTTQPEPAPTTPKRLRRWALIIGAAAVLIIVIAALSGGGESAGKPTASPSSSTSSSSTTSSTPPAEPVVEPEPAAHVPTKSDFVWRVKVTSKHCFGSAGCNVEYKIVPKYLGAACEGTYAVGYTLHGDENGTQTDTASVECDGDTLHYSFSEEGFASTSGRSAKLTVKTTSVESE